MSSDFAAGLLLAATVAVTVVVSEVLDLDYSTCLTLDPFESALPQTSPFPYFLNISKTGVIHNQDSVILTIRSPDPRIEFERFLVQARDKTQGVPVGLFVDTGDADIRLFNCFHRPEEMNVVYPLYSLACETFGRRMHRLCYQFQSMLQIIHYEYSYLMKLCGQNTAVEFDQEPKREARMRWMPDYDYNGTIRIIATVVQTKEIYWLRQLVAELEVYNPW